MRTPQHLGPLDGDFIARERLAHGLSRRALGLRLGLSPNVIIHMELHGGHDRLTLGLLLRLCDVLEIDASRALRGKPDECKPTADDVQVEAALAEAGHMVHRDQIARGFGWNAARTSEAFQQLERRLLPTGQRLRAGRRGWWGLGAAADALTLDDERAFHRARISEHSLKHAAAADLHRLLRGRELRPSTGWQPGQRGTEGRATLLRAQLVTVTKGGLAVHPDVLFSLGLIADRAPPATVLRRTAAAPRRVRRMSS